MTNLQKNMYDAQGKHIKVICKDGDVVEGYCDFYTQPIDNEPEIAEISLRQGTGRFIGITEDEIKEIEYLN